MYNEKGKVIDKLAKVTGTSAKGDWTKQEFVIETLDDKYPKLICLTMFNDKFNIVDTLRIGEVIDVTFSIESRAYNERYFTNVNCFKIDKATKPLEPIYTPIIVKTNDLPF